MVPGLGNKSRGEKNKKVVGPAEVSPSVYHPLEVKLQEGVFTAILEQKNIKMEWEI